MALLRSVLFSVLFSMAATGRAQLALFDDCDVECHKALHHSSFKQDGNVSGVNVTHQSCHWSVNPSARYISGYVQTVYTAVSAVEDIVMDLHSSLVVDSVKRKSLQLNFTHNNHILSVSNPTPAGATDTITVYYHGEPGNSGFGSFVQAEHEGAPIVWTLSQPYGARDWWPCFQNLTDKIDSLDVYITTPTGYTGVSNGLLADTSQTDTSVTFHWKHRYPIATYLIAISVTNYVQYTDTVVLTDYTVPVHNFVFPESENEARAATAKLANQMQLFDSLFGYYPFKGEKYGHAQFGWGGGMEHQTITFMGGWGWELMAHELAHHWFGDAVTCGSWQDIWLNEGFATYLSGLCYEFIDPQWWMAFKNDRMNRATLQPDGSVFCTDTTEVSRIFNGRMSYAKGAMLLHTLRWLVGDSTFFYTLRNYMQHPNLYFGFARSTDLIAEFKKNSAEDIENYFNKFLYGEGYPSYEILWNTGTTNELLLAVHQTTSHPSVEFYDLPIPIRCFGEGKDTTFRLRHIFSGQVFRLAVPFKTDSVAFDPDRWILSHNNTVHRINHPKPANDLLIDLMPVPFNEYLTVRVLSLNPEQVVTVKVVDVSGKLLYSEKMESPTQTVISDNWPAGVYQVLFSTDNGIIARSVLKQNQ